MGGLASGLDNLTTLQNPPGYESKWEDANKEEIDLLNLSQSRNLINRNLE